MSHWLSILIALVLVSGALAMPISAQMGGETNAVSTSSPVQTPALPPTIAPPPRRTPSPVPHKQVGLVIGFPDGQEHLEIVTAPMTATTFEVLQSAKIVLVSQNTIYGPAICAINDVGCPASNCFCDPEHFWAYYHLDATNRTWVAAEEGVGTNVPAGGAVEGFAWSGLGAGAVKPPVYTFGDIVAKTTGMPFGIPEPATILLLGAGLGGLAGYVRFAQARRRTLRSTET